MQNASIPQIFGTLYAELEAKTAEIAELKNQLQQLRQAPPPPPPPAPLCYEYTIRYNVISDDLNELSAAGWEIMHITQQSALPATGRATHGALTLAATGYTHVVARRQLSPTPQPEPLPPTPTDDDDDTTPPPATLAPAARLDGSLVMRGHYIDVTATQNFAHYAATRLAAQYGAV